MKNQLNSIIEGHFIRSALFLVALLAVCLIPFALGQRQIDAPSLQTDPTGLICNPGGWEAGADLPSPAVRMIGVFFPSNARFYGMGGRSSDDPGSDFVHPFEYDAFANTWTPKTATYPDNEVSNMACGILTDNGTPYIYCVGGSAAGNTTATDRVFRYDPVADAITTVAAPWPGDVDGVTLPGGFTVFQNKLYILGGFQIDTAMTDQIWEFTPKTTTWVQKTALPVQRGYVPATTIGTLIFTAGGSLWDGTTLQDSTDSFVYNPVTDSISPIPSIPRATGETRALNFNNKMWVMGGGRTEPNPSNEVNIYDPAAGTWSTGLPFTTARRNFPIDTNGTFHIGLAGGYASDGVTPLASMEIFCTLGVSPTPTATATASATATATPTTTPPATPTATPTAPPSATPRVTPRPRPTPHPRPTP